MSESAKALLEEFEALPLEDRQQVLVQPLRRTPLGDEPLSDQALVESTELLFLELDKQETER